MRKVFRSIFKLGILMLGVLGVRLPAAAQTYTVEDLGTLGGDRSAATAINASGQVVGSSTRADGRSHAFLYTDEEGMRDLGAFVAFPPASFALGINDAGVVVGQSSDLYPGPCAFVWNGQMRYLIRACTN